MPRVMSASDNLLCKFDAVTISIGHAEGSMSRGDKSKVYEALRECRSNLHVLREHVLKLNAELSDAHERGYQLGLNDGSQATTGVTKMQFIKIEDNSYRTVYDNFDEYKGRKVDKVRITAEGTTEVVLLDPQGRNVDKTLVTKLAPEEILPLLGHTFEVVPEQQAGDDKATGLSAVEWRDLHTAANTQIEQLRKEVEDLKLKLSCAETDVKRVEAENAKLTMLREDDRKELIHRRSMVSSRDTQIQKLTELDDEWQRVVRGEFGGNTTVTPADLRDSLRNRFAKRKALEGELAAVRAELVKQKAMSATLGTQLKQAAEQLAQRGKAAAKEPELDFWRVLRTAYDQLKVCYGEATADTVAEAVYEAAYMSLYTVLVLNKQTIEPVYAVEAYTRECGNE